jgi:hypothetical protein
MENNQGDDSKTIIDQIIGKDADYHKRIAPMILSVIDPYCLRTDSKLQQKSSENDFEPISDEIIKFHKECCDLKNELKNINPFVRDELERMIDQIIRPVEHIVHSIEFKRNMKISDIRYKKLQILFSTDEKIFDGMKLDLNKRFEAIKNKIPKILSLVTQKKTKYVFNNINDSILIDTYYSADRSFIHDVIVKFIKDAFTILENMMINRIIPNDNYERLHKLHTDYIGFEDENNGDFIENSIDEIIAICPAARELFGWIKKIS